MEAKGCAKSMVWKDSRRWFYWALRARLARSAALTKLAEASPASSHEYRSRLLDDLASVDATSDNRVVAEALEQIDLSRTVTQLKADHLLRSLLDVVNEDRKAAMDSLLRLVDELSEEERASLGSVLRDPAPRSGELSSYCRRYR
jgi:acetyl-CoA carboxylase/biotin carboxylase 1